MCLDGLSFRSCVQRKRRVIHDDLVPFLVSFLLSALTFLTLCLGNNKYLLMRRVMFMPSSALSLGSLSLHLGFWPSTAWILILSSHGGACRGWVGLPSGLADIVNWMWIGGGGEAGGTRSSLAVCGVTWAAWEALTSPLPFLFDWPGWGPSPGRYSASPGDSDVQPLGQCSVALCVHGFGLGCGGEGAKAASRPPCSACRWHRVTQSPAPGAPALRRAVCWACCSRSSSDPHGVLVRQVLLDQEVPISNKLDKCAVWS